MKYKKILLNQILLKTDNIYNLMHVCCLLRLFSKITKIIQIASKIISLNDFQYFHETIIITKIFVCVFIMEF